MLRISSLIRNKAIFRKIPIRGGAPGWDRPDPPPSANVPVDHQLSDEQILFHFPDKNMPQFFLTQPEIYQGDTFREGAYNFFAGWGTFIFAAAFIGGVMYLGIPSHKDGFYSEYMHQYYKKDKQMVDKKQWLMWAKQNPMGIELSQDFFPQNGDIAQSSVALEAKKCYDNVTKPNKEIQSYLTKIKAQSQEKIRNRHSEQHGSTEKKDH